MNTLLLFVLNILALKLFIDIIMILSVKRQKKLEDAKKKRIGDLTGKEEIEDIKPTPSLIKTGPFPKGFSHFATSFWGMGTLISFVLTVISIFY